MTLNKNIEAALEQIEASETDKAMLRNILYEEHINRESDWDKDAPKVIREIIHRTSKEDSYDIN